jgi:hypothetical protein
MLQAEEVDMFGKLTRPTGWRRGRPRKVTMPAPENNGDDA